MADRLYILGDFFEAWVGDDNKNEFNAEIMEALRNHTQQGHKVFFMHGNRDFLVGQRFADATGVTLITDPTVIDLYGQPTLLMHGDSLCTHDKKHQRSRRRMQNPTIKKFINLLPLSIRERGAKKLRAQSQERKTQLPQRITDVSSDEVIRVMEKENVKLLIHGHTHRPAIHVVNLPSGMAQRTVLGAWYDYGSVLMHAEDGWCELMELRHAN